MVDGVFGISNSFAFGVKKIAVRLFSGKKSLRSLLLDVALEIWLLTLLFSATNRKSTHLLGSLSFFSQTRP